MSQKFCTFQLILIDGYEGTSACTGTQTPISIQHIHTAQYIMLQIFSSRIPWNQKKNPSA